MSVVIAIAAAAPLIERANAQDQKKAGQADQRREAIRPLDAMGFDDPSKIFERLWGGSDPDDALLDQIAISADDEHRSGKTAVDSYLRHLRSRRINVFTKGKDAEYLRSLVGQIQPLMKNRGRYRRIDVYIADSTDFDARSFPGGTLVFFRGALQLAESEAALIGIVGHELSHLDHGHQLLDLKRFKLAEQLAQKNGGSFSPQQFLNGGTTLMRLWSRPFRPEDESAADLDGVTWAYQVGYDPRELARLFGRLNERHPDARGFAPAFFRTHPFNAERQDAVMTRYEELQDTLPQENLYIGKENLQRRIPRSDRAFAE